LYSLINSQNPDFVAFQELQDILVENTTTIVEDVIAEFSGDYAFYTGTLQTDGPEKYRNVIMYKSDTLEFTSGGSFRLSEQINDGSVFDPYTRICTWAIFSRNELPLKIYNCHYPSLNPSGQIVASQTVLDSLGAEKAILMGDFNAAWNSEPITMFINEGFGNRELLSQSAPDHILSKLGILSYNITVTADSDHPLVIAEIRDTVEFKPATFPALLDLIFDDS
jgi:endonuclease/exonuclease/phosphatase family metal-dependent hydrolase